MKQAKFLCICIGIAAFALLVSCGEAGVQIKVGGDYDSEFTADSPIYEFAQTFSESASTTVNSEIREHGDVIKELEVKSLTVTMKNFDNTVNGEITVDISGNTFSSGSVTISDGSVISLTPDQSNGLVNISNTLRNGDVSIGLTLNSDAPFGDDNFNLTLSILAFATVQVDQDQ